MISEYELANIITGATRAEGGVARKSSATILGKAVEDSENGMVRVVPEGDVFAPDGDNTIIIPTSPSVRAGDTVQIGLVGGVSKRPMVMAVSGEGDSQNVRIGAIEADYVKASTLDADVANIGYLKATSATITDLQAQTAKVQNLTAEQLEAASGYIGDLQAENIEASDIIADHGFVDDLSAGSVTASQINAAAGYVGSLTAGNVTAANLVADHGTVGNLSTTYAQIDAANITDLTAKNAWVEKLLVDTELIAHEGAIFTLDAIQLNADRITAGTIDVERLVVTIDGEKYLVHIDTSGSTPVTSYEKLDGDIIEDLTITADKIVAGAITAEKITTENIVGTGGWINLRSGTFAYGNASSGDYIAWDGSNLTIRAASLNLSSYATKKQLEESANMLLDADAPSITKVHAAQNRYWSDAGNTMITCSFASLSDPPEIGIENAARFVCDGTQTAKKARGLRFYNGSGNIIPLTAGQTYTATWWARCTAGSGTTHLTYSDSSISGGYTNSADFTPTSRWKKYTWTFSPVSLSSSVYLWFVCAFNANTSGTIELCGFKLVAGDSAENVSAELSVQADKIAMVVDNSTTSSSLVLTSQAMDYIGDHVEIKGTDGTTTVISGGQIQTGSLTIGVLDSASQADILNSNIEVGGTNLLWESGTFDGWMTRGGTSGVSVSDGVWTVTMSGYTSNTNNSKRQWIGSGLLADYWGKYIVISFDIMSPDWSAVEEGSYTGLNAVSMQICTDTAAPHGGAIGSTGRYHFSRLGNGTANAQIWSHTPETVTNGEWLHFVSKPLLVNDSLFNYDTTKVDGYTGWLFEVMLRRNGTISVRHPQIEIGNKPTSWSPAPEDGIAYVDSLQVSSTNLVRNGDFSNGTAYWVRQTDVTFSTETDSTYGTVLKAVQAAAGASTARFYPDTTTSFTHATGETYTVSFYAKADAANTIKVDRGFSATNVYLNKSIGTSWKRYTGTLTSGGTGTISFSLGSAGTLYLAKVMLVRGDKYMDWSPDPRDVKGSIQAVYGTCSTAAGTAAKAVTCANFQLFTGARIAVKFSTASTVAAPTLNVNGTGAKAIWYNNAVASTSNPVLWGANATLSFVYDGTEWVLDEKPPSYSATYSTASSEGTRDKAVTVAGALVVNGTELTVNFSIANTYVSSSVRINLSSTGATAIYVNRTATSTTNKLLWPANTTLTFVRQGAGWYLADNGQRKYITQIDDDGISIHAANNPTNNYAQINANGLEVFKGATSIAKFGDTARVGVSGSPNVEITSFGVTVNHYGTGPTASSLINSVFGDAGITIASLLQLQAIDNGTTKSAIIKALLNSGLYLSTTGTYLSVLDDGIRYERSARADETPGADIAITKTYNSNGFRIENAVFHATADMVVLPIQFAATSVCQPGICASIPATYAPKDLVRVVVFEVSNNWDAPFPGWANIDTDGNIGVYGPGSGASAWFGQAVWIRK